MPENNGSYVTRSEMGAHMRRVDDNIAAIREDVAEIRQHVGAGPKWVGARANAVIDKILPAVIAIGALWVLGERFGG